MESAAIHTTSGDAVGSGEELTAETVVRKDLSVPLDIIFVIAQFLVGGHAFGSLAALNLVGHNVRDVTLPVLYETLMLDHAERLHHYKDGCREDLAGFQFTRFLFTRKAFHVPLAKLPNLIVIIYVQCSRCQSSPTMKISIRKPVKSATLFGVIAATPVDFAQADDTDIECDAFGRPLAASTVATYKPLFHTMQQVDHIQSENGACLLPELSVPSLLRITCQLRDSGVGRFTKPSGLLQDVLSQMQSI